MPGVQEQAQAEGQAMTQYVTRVSKFTVVGKSHQIVPQPYKSWILTACEKEHYYLSFEEEAWNQV